MTVRGAGGDVRAAVVGGVCLLGAGVVLWGLLTGIGGGPTAVPASTEEERALTASQRFLDGYLDEDGRVVRSDEDGSTVSEGQAYAMLLAVAIGDEESFDRAWSWAAENLQRDDGLLSYLWRDGRVADPSPATDADLDAARALLLAAERFGELRYREEGLRIGRAVLEQETASARGRSTVAAGPWATEKPVTVNPSYFAPRSFALLGAASGDPRWRELERTSRKTLAALVAGRPRLPPDWARLEPGGPVATPAPADPESRPAYGYDAVRVPVRWAEACSPENRALGSRPWAFLREQSQGTLGASYSLDGALLAPGPSSPALVGAAGAAHAAGDEAARDDLLDRAEAADAQHSTYYGSAWVALGRVMLTTDWLGPC